MFCGIISMKSNLKKHTVLNQTGEKPFTPIFVASWPLRRPNGRSILHYSIQGRNTFQHVLWHHGQKEVTSEEAHCAEPNCLSQPVLWRHGHYEDQTEGQYSTAPYRGGTLSCMFCGIMVSRKSNLKNHTVLSQTAFHCQFCGIMAITKTKLKEHTSLLNTGDKSFSASFVASWSV